ncbi:MAG: hypothetical protein E7050_03470 [Lentisphaerae bacterium]|nr:hypothetical protein [Lentisphaerota bacterium]
MRCPHCGEESFAKKKNLTENWKVIGVVEVCALCGKEWKKSSPSDAGKNSDAGKSRLAALLGGDFTEKVVLSGEAESSFCRNCRHFLVHPFKSICALTDLEADPAGECGRFEKRPSGGKEDQ